jgi:hypothetical protein
MRPFAVAVIPTARNIGIDLRTLRAHQSVTWRVLAMFSNWVALPLYFHNTGNKKTKSIVFICDWVMTRLQHRAQHRSICNYPSLWPRGHAVLARSPQLLRLRLREYIGCLIIFSPFYRTWGPVGSNFATYSRVQGFRYQTRNRSPSRKISWYHCGMDECWSNEHRKIIHC